MPAHGGHRAGYFTAHRSQMTANLFSHRFHRIIWLSIGIGLPQLPGRADDFYFVPSGGIHHILFHHYLCHLQDGKKSFGYICNAKIKTQWKSKIQSLDQIHEAARQFRRLVMGDNTVFALYGKMGAGKTNFHQSRLRGWAFPTIITPSPLSTNDRSDTAGELIYHFDFYRIETGRSV